MTEAAPVPGEAPPDENWNVPWGLGTVLGAILIAFASFVAGSTIVVQEAGLHPPIQWAIIGYQSLTLGVLMSAVLLVLFAHHLTPRSLGYRWPGWSAMAAAALCVVLITLGAYVVQEIFNALFPGFNVHGNVRELGNSIKGHPGVVAKVLIVAWASIEVPLTEETLFRGIIFQGLRRFFDRWVPYHLAVFIAAALSGTLFGLAHGEPHTLPILIFVGMALAYIFQYARSIYASALVHGLINALAMVSLLKQV
jgi:membrane protease YdiL (CAAX protease family)